MSSKFVSGDKRGLIR